MIRRGFLRTLIASVLCVGLGPIASHASDDPLKVGYLQFTAFGTINVAETQGWFEDTGVDVELVLFDSGPPLLEAMVSGAIDIGALGGVPVLRTASQEVFDLRVISVVADVSGPSKVVSNNDINSLDDLRDKKVSIPWATTQHFVMGKALEQNGMTLDDVDLIQMEVLDAQAAFIAGRIDAFVPAPSALNRVLSASDNAKILFETSDFTSPVFIFDLWAAPQRVLDARLEDVQKVLSVFHGQAVPYFTNTDSSSQAASDLRAWLNNVVGADLSDEEVAQQVEFLTFLDSDAVKAMATDGSLRTVLENQSKFLMDVGILETLPDFDEMIDLRVLEGL